MLPSVKFEGGGKLFTLENHLSIYACVCVHNLSLCICTDIGIIILIFLKENLAIIFYLALTRFFFSFQIHAQDKILLLENYFV